MKPLDLDTARAIAPRLCDEHREEILRDHESLEDWALSRADMKGFAYAVDGPSGPVLIGGVADRGEAGYLWIAGADGWKDHLLTMLRVFREVRRSKAYRYLECDCFADNDEAQNMLHRLGFTRHGVTNGVVNFRMAL